MLNFIHLDAIEVSSMFIIVHEVLSKIEMFSTSGSTHT